MRTFLAIPMPEEIRKKLAQAIDRFSPVAEGVHWVAKDQFHITILFFEDLSPAFVPHLTQVIRQVCEKTPAFSCDLESYGFWGTKRNPTSIWVSATCPPELELLQENLTRTIKRVGIQLPDTKFVPHVTLCRCKAGSPHRELLSALDADQDADFGTLAVNRLALYQSRLQPKGPVHKLIEKFALR